jgi:hypothetical protein
MSEFRGPLPLDDRDFAEVRGKVMAKLERRSFAVPLTLAAAAMIALVILLLPVWRRAPSPAVERPTAAAPTHSVAPSSATVADVPQPTPAPVKIARKEPLRKTALGAPPSDSETQITMNIETADPNVRIIWISR